MRIDKYLAERFGSRSKAADAIERGLVLVNDAPCRTSYELKEGDKLQFIDGENYVSAGGFKLAKALRDFGFDVSGKVFADIGASTGGFTDCLIKNGAKKVYCIDVGDSQLDKKLICDKTVVIDNCNARYLKGEIFSEEPDGIVIDVSFISLTYILGAAGSVLKDGGNVIALIKPQFECESRKVGKNGIVRDAESRKRAVVKICDFALKCGLIPRKLTSAPIIDGKNREYLVLLEKTCGTDTDIEKLIKSVNFLN